MDARLLSRLTHAYDEAVPLLRNLLASADEEWVCRLVDALTERVGNKDDLTEWVIAYLGFVGFAAVCQEPEDV